jgi:hypothetical protein
MMQLQRLIQSSAVQPVSKTTDGFSLTLDVVHQHMQTPPFPRRTHQYLLRSILV